MLGLAPGYPGEKFAVSGNNICRAAVQLAIGLAFALTATTASASCIDSQGTPWAGIGLSKPKWLEQCVERRLRLLAAVPNAEKQAGSDANGYIGGNHSGPGLAVGVVLDDGLYYSNGFGYSDLAKKTRPDETTLFETGSLTKVITGSALLTLIDRPNSNISLDDDVVAKGWMPSLANACPPASCKITPRNLVSHTSGLPDSLKGVNMPEAQFLNALPAVALAFKPGDWSAYSGVGTAVVGLIIKHDSAEQSYDHYVINHLFLPLGMTHSGFDPSQIDVSKLAVKYDLQNCSAPIGLVDNCTAWSFASNTSYDPNADTSVLIPTAAYFTSVWDLARFMQMWLVLTAPNNIIKPATLQIGSASLITPPASPVQTPICASAAQNNGAGYQDPAGNFYRSCGSAAAFGANWVVSTNPKTLWHNGGLSEWASNTLLDLDHGMGVTVLLSTTCPPIPCVIYPVTSDFSNSILSQDGQKTWGGSVLAEGTARLLWLSGATPPPGVGGPVKMPGPVPTVNSNPNTVTKPPAGYVVVGHWMMEPVARQKYQLALLAQFSQSFRAQHGLADITIEPFLSKLFAASHHCSNFRVRGAPSSSNFRARAAPNSATVILRLKCQQQAFDATVQVDSSGLITGITDAGPVNDAY
jgi:CubicO group peptidase (beta-lactamase class C family)